MSDTDLADAVAAAVAGRSRRLVQDACDPAVQLEDPLADGPIVGVRDVADHLARLWAALPDVACERVADPLTDGTGALAVALRVTGTHTGETGELPPTGLALHVDAVVWCAIRDGRVWRARAFYDAFGAAQQLGILPARGGVGERALLLLRGFGLRG